MGNNVIKGKKRLLSVINSVLCVGVVMPFTGSVLVQAEPLTETATQASAPSYSFDLSHWKITLPMLDDKPKRKGKVMEISSQQLSRGYSHPDWFYRDVDSGVMVFKAPNKAKTTPNSHNARSELRAMIADDNKISSQAAQNNFVLVSHADAKQYGAIGGHLSAVLAVDWVSQSGNDKKYGAHAVVIGQIHGSKNEPLKIYYRKLPNHQYGSLFWSYETNPKQAKLRKNVLFDIWGKAKLTAAEPDPKQGIALGEKFSYQVDIVGNMMTLVFTKHLGLASQQSVVFEHDLSQPLKQDNLPAPDLGYSQDWMYFKAGVYNQCNTSSSGCLNRGLSAGDYTQASFYQLELKH